MKFNSRIFQRAAVVASALVFSSVASAQWSLDLDNSQLSFVTVKAEHIAEVHSFSRLEGRIDEAGNALISIDLTSVETGIAIRNERMQSMLFETGLYPQATVSAAINTDALSAIVVGEDMTLDTQLTLALHGGESVISAPLRVTRQADGVRVTTLAPLIITAESVGLVAGVESLREIAGLPSISRAVPVTFSVKFVAD
ncbi:MAG: YceI family protein [Proteobacteria bacterium]|nr:YceI family protein [Pseudomonadota bacterium]MDA0897393.1 YceI family protein [Pseudomonadota bacterium]MDA1244848.1 YceI family protein [Pseudomonadota bacterium]